MFLPLLKYRLASPILFLLVMGGAIAVADYWMRRQLPLTPATSAKSKARKNMRRAPVKRQRPSKQKPSLGAPRFA